MFIVVRIEQPQLLTAMHGVKRVVDVQHEAARHLAEALAVVVHHGAPPAQQGTRIRQVLEARDGRLRAVAITRQAAHGQLEHRVAAQAAIISMRVRMISSRPWVTRPGWRGSRMQAAKRCAMASRCSTSRSTSSRTGSPPSDDMQPASKRATTALPPAGDEPGSVGVGSTLTGMRSGVRWDWCRHPNPTPYQRLVPCPSALMNDPG